MARKVKRTRTEYESRGPSGHEMPVDETAPPRRSPEAQRRSTKKNKNKGKVIKILAELKDEVHRLFGNQSKMLEKLIESQTCQSKNLEKLIESHTCQSKNLEKLTESQNDLCKQWELHTNNAPRSQWNQEQPPRYRLVFRSEVPGNIEKGKTIEIHVALVDVTNGQTVKNGPLASATVELVVIDAKFNENNNQYSWSVEDFRSNMKKARQGNSATVNGDQSGESLVSNGRFNLENGDKHHREFSIFSNSGNKKVRLGVMVVSPITEERVLEGLSNPFFVRGHDRPNRSVHDGCPDQNGPMPHMHIPLWTNLTQGLDTIGQTDLHSTGNTNIAYTEPNASQVHQASMLQNHDHCQMNNGTDLMKEHFGSLIAMPKEVMQTRRERGVLIEPIEPDDSDEGQPRKRTLHQKYQLRFVNKVCGAYYTRDQIKADDGNLLKVALFDENNTKITSAPLSFASVEVVALHGDFNGDDQDDWTSEEFNLSIVSPPPGEEASSVLGGDHILVLAGGEACLGDAFFLTTSFCARTGKFKMGVMLASTQEERIQEGISEPFCVMDHYLPGFISNCSSWKSDSEPPVFRASTSSAPLPRPASRRTASSRVPGFFCCCCRRCASNTMDGGSGNASGGRCASNTMDGRSGNASGKIGSASTCCYYVLLGIRKNASATDIRTAYRRLAMMWHPDRWASDPGAAGDAKRRFQQIQEAYSVLSDKGKKAMYDAGLFDPLDDDDQDFSDFMQEMLVMMDNVKNEAASGGENNMCVRPFGDHRSTLQKPDLLEGIVRCWRAS